MINCLIWKLKTEIFGHKLKYTDMETRLVSTEGSVCKDRKNHELKN